MRPLTALHCAAALVGGLLLCSPAAAAPTGGSAAPKAGTAPAREAGGAAYATRGQGLRPVRGRSGQGRRPVRGRSGPLLVSFTLRRSRLLLYGAPAEVGFRIRSRARLAAVGISITPDGARRPVATIHLKARRSGRVLLTGRERGVLREGRYRLRISARDVRGRALRRGAGISSSSRLTVLHHVFPVAGPFTYGGADGRFGADRGDHSHQGQDMAAPEGTPVVAPRGGLVEAVQYQARGAGHYVVLDGAGEERDYVFMHLRTGSIPVRAGQTVRTGQTIGQVGNTGRSFGAHLHFEIWAGEGWFSGGRPIDPLPLLEAWARLTRSRA